MKSIFLLVITLLLACQKDTPPIDYSILKNPLSSNTGDSVYYHIDVYTALKDSYYYANVYTSQSVKDDVIFSIKWTSSFKTSKGNDTLINYSGFARIPYKYTKYGSSLYTMFSNQLLYGSLPSPSSTYNTITNVTPIYTGSDKRKFIQK